MRKVSLLLSIAGLLLMQGACKKTSEDVIDCIAEGILVSVKYSADASDSKKINFEINYDGTHTIKSVEWIFGDGTTATVNSTTTTHAYSSAGSYALKAKVSIVSGSSSCTPELEKSITVN